MELLFCPALYSLRVNSMRAEISLTYDTDLKVPSTIEAHLRPPRGLDKK